MVFSPSCFLLFQNEEKSQSEVSSSSPACVSFALSCSGCSLVGAALDFHCHTCNSRECGPGTSSPSSLFTRSVIPGCVSHSQGLLWLFVDVIALLLRRQIRKLRRELDASQEKVSALTTQLSANVRTNTQTHTLLCIHSCQLALVVC